MYSAMLLVGKPRRTLVRKEQKSYTVYTLIQLAMHLPNCPIRATPIAMATEPECMVPIRRADHVVLIGDHRQLHPVLNNREAEQMGLGRSLFERYVDEVGVKAHMLQVQYRMVSGSCIGDEIMTYTTST